VDFLREVPANVGEVIRKVRKDLKLSLEEAAQKTGVSKAMLGQIERGESSPTVSTLWKISSGLRITFSRLLSKKTQDYRVTDLSEIRPFYEAGQKMALYNIFPFDPVTGFDYFYIVLEPGCRYTSPTHPNVLEESVVVTEGELLLEIEKKSFVLREGASIKFRGDAAHAYANTTAQRTVFQNIMKY
jgi:transcriptional regulator with XRE-family HTH domain